MAVALTDTEYLQSIWAALVRLEELAGRPPPTVEVAPPQVTVNPTPVVVEPARMDNAALAQAVATALVPPIEGGFLQLAKELIALRTQLDAKAAASETDGQSKMTHQGLFLDQRRVLGPLTNDELRSAPVPVDLVNLEQVNVTLSGGPFDVTLLNDSPANKYKPGIRTTTAVQISGLGNNTIVTPAVGKKLRVFWIGMSASPDDPNVLAIAKFTNTGASKYRWNIGAFSHWEPIEGGVDEPLVINLSAAQAVQVGVTYEEV